MMRRHLKFMSERECQAARAPAALEKDILRRAFWKVDPQRTGSVSLQQFLQVGPCARACDVCVRMRVRAGRARVCVRTRVGGGGRDGDRKGGHVC